MANVDKIGGKWCVTHGKTGAVLNRGGVDVCYTNRGTAQADANATKCKVTGGKLCPVRPTPGRGA